MGSFWHSIVNTSIENLARFLSYCIPTQIIKGSYTTARCYNRGHNNDMILPWRLGSSRQCLKWGSTCSYQSDLYLRISFGKYTQKWKSINVFQSKTVLIKKLHYYFFVTFGTFFSGEHLTISCNLWLFFGVLEI